MTGAEQGRVSGANIRIFPGLMEACQGVAVRFAELVEKAAAEGRSVSVACSGGETPRALFALLATPEFARRIPWKHVHLFQVDERCVPPNHEQSNYRMVRETLLDRVPEAAAQFHRIAAERSNLEAVAQDYAEEIRHVLAPPESQWPRFDLILLGMGDDGHTASLFPGSAALEEKSKWVTPNFVPKLKASRITLTFPVLNAAAQAAFLVAGSEKGERLKEVLEGPSDRYPAQFVRLISGELWWYIDEGAARLLSSMRRNQP
jgi:6-phosphogluconolactonase